MNRIILIITFLLQSFLILAQDSQPIDKYNFDKDCGNGGQQDMNVCFNKAEEKLSKIMQIKYECLTTYLDSRIKFYSIKDTSTASDYIKMKRIIISSQAIWENLKVENTRFYEGGGGTITPMLIAESLIRDLKDRLKRLDGFIEEIGQGEDVEVLKCE